MIFTNVKTILVWFTMLPLDKCYTYSEKRLIQAMEIPYLCDYRQLNYAVTNQVPGAINVIYITITNTRELT